MKRESYLPVFAPLFALFIFLILSSSNAHAATIQLGAGGDLQGAINSAQPGDTIVLQAGATYFGPIILKNKPGSSWITIRTSTPDGSLPAEGVRITPAYSHLLPKIVSRGRGDSALQTEAGAHHYKFLGIEFTQESAGAVIYDLVRLGDSGEYQNNLKSVPHHIIIDRCYLHSYPDAPLKRGIALNSAHTEILNSYLEGFKAEGQDSQAICGWNGPGPFRIINNHLEGAAENIMFGGATPGIYNLVPSDIEIRRNYFYKPLSWKGSRWLIKNLFELKTAQRVVLDGNLMENSWRDGQDGFAILLTVRTNVGETPGAVVSNVQITNNIIRHANHGFLISGEDGHGNGNPGYGGNITIQNNVFEDIGGNAWGGTGKFIVVTKTKELTVDHNTVFHTGNITEAFGHPCQNFSFTNNLISHNAYGLHGDGRNPGNPSISTYFPSSRIARNVIAGGRSSDHPPDNFFPSSIFEASFVDTNRGNYRLSSSSPFKSKGTDGKDLGADLDKLEAAMLKSSDIVTPVTPPVIAPKPDPKPEVPKNDPPKPKPTPANVSSLEGDWNRADIGGVYVAGSSSYFSGTYMLKGAGVDIWDFRDSFHFTYKTLTGDGEIVARLLSVQHVHEWTKAGVMIRDGFEDNSNHAMMAVTPANGAAFQRRFDVSQLSRHTGVQGVTAPHWVKLVRRGNQFSGYVSENGTDWIHAGTDTISMKRDVLIGLVITSHEPHALASASFDNVSVGKIEEATSKAEFSEAAAKPSPVASIPPSVVNKPVPPNTKQLISIALTKSTQIQSASPGLTEINSLVKLIEEVLGSPGASARNLRIKLEAAHFSAKAAANILAKSGNMQSVRYWLNSCTIYLKRAQLEA
jgi:hypothetical protein